MCLLTLHKFTLKLYISSANYINVSNAQPKIRPTSFKILFHLKVSKPTRNPHSAGNISSRRYWRGLHPWLPPLHVPHLMSLIFVSICTRVRFGCCYTWDFACNSILRIRKTLWDPPKKLKYKFHTRMRNKFSALRGKPKNEEATHTHTARPGHAAHIICI